MDGALGLGLEITGSLIIQVKNKLKKVFLKVNPIIQDLTPILLKNRVAFFIILIRMR